MLLFIIDTTQHDEGSNYHELSDIKKPSTASGTRLFYGGERGIRTLGRVLADTRFPVVRLRPAQPPFRGECLLCIHLRQLQYYSTLFREMQYLFQKNFKKCRLFAVYLLLFGICRAIFPSLLQILRFSAILNMAEKAFFTSSEYALIPPDFCYHYLLYIPEDFLWRPSHTA